MEAIARKKEKEMEALAKRKEKQMENLSKKQAADRKQDEYESQIKVPHIKLEKFQIPVLPDAPNSQISQTDFLQLAKKVYEAFGI